DNQNRTQEAEEGGAEHNRGAVALDERGFATGRSDLLVCRGDQAIDASGEIARQSIVLSQKPFALCQDSKLVPPRLGAAVRAVGQTLEFVDTLPEAGPQLFVDLHGNLFKSSERTT